MLHNSPLKNHLVMNWEFLSLFPFIICFPFILELEMTSHGFGADHPDDDDDEDYSEDEEFGRSGRPNKSSSSGGGHSRIMEEEYDIVGFERYKRQREKEKTGALQLSGRNPIHNDNNNSNNNSMNSGGSGKRGALPFLRKNAGSGSGSGGGGSGYGNLPSAEDDDEYGIVDE
jgi:hypothetical protein